MPESPRVNPSTPAPDATSPDDGAPVAPQGGEAPSPTPDPDSGSPTPESTPSGGRRNSPQENVLVIGKIQRMKQVFPVLKAQVVALSQQVEQLQALLQKQNQELEDLREIRDMYDAMSDGLPTPEELPEDAEIPPPPEEGSDG